MRTIVRETLYALLYAGACAGLVYCCGSCFWRLGDVASGKVLYGVLVLFGAYGAFLCGQTSVEIVQGLRQVDELEPEDVAEAVAAVAGQVALEVTGSALEESGSP